MGKIDFNQFIHQRNQLVVAAENFPKKQNLSPVIQSTLSKNMEKQLKLVHKLIDVIDCPNRRICVAPLHYKVDNPETFYAQVRLFGRMKEEENFQQIVYVKYEQEFVNLLEVMNSVYDDVSANQPICNVLKKLLQLFALIIFLFIPVKMSWNIGDKRNFFLKLKTKLGMYHVEFSKPEVSHEQITPTLVETQQLPDTGKVDSKDEISCLKWTI